MSTIKHAVLMIILTSLYLSAPASAENIKVNYSQQTLKMVHFNFKHALYAIHQMDGEHLMDTIHNYQDN